MWRHRYTDNNELQSTLCLLFLASVSFPSYIISPHAGGAENAAQKIIDDLGDGPGRVGRVQFLPGPPGWIVLSSGEPPLAGPFLLAVLGTCCSRIFCHRSSNSFRMSRCRTYSHAPRAQAHSHTRAPRSGLYTRAPRSGTLTRSGGGVNRPWPFLRVRRISESGPSMPSKTAFCA